MSVNAFAPKQFQALQDITSINFSDASQGQGNSLAGAIKGITEDQANLLVGQFSGLRLQLLDRI